MTYVQLCAAHPLQLFSAKYPVSLMSQIEVFLGMFRTYLVNGHLIEHGVSMLEDCFLQPFLPTMDMLKIISSVLKY